MLSVAPSIAKHFTKISFPDGIEFKVVSPVKSETNLQLSELPKLHLKFPVYESILEKRATSPDAIVCSTGKIEYFSGLIFKLASGKSSDSTPEIIA